MASAVWKDFESDPVLYKRGPGCRVYFRADIHDPVYNIMQGPRVLDTVRKFFRSDSGVDVMYRFALFIPEIDYDYKDKKKLLYLEPIHVPMGYPAVP